MSCARTCGKSENSEVLVARRRKTYENRASDREMKTNYFFQKEDGNYDLEVKPIKIEGFRLFFHGLGGYLVMCRWFYLFVTLYLVFT